MLYEHDVLPLPTGGNYWKENSANFMNDLSEQGWEVVGAFAREKSDHSAYIIVRRPKG